MGDKQFMWSITCVFRPALLGRILSITGENWHLVKDCRSQQAITAKAFLKNLFSMLSFCKENNPFFTKLSVIRLLTFYPLSEEVHNILKLQ